MTRTPANPGRVCELIRQLQTLQVDLPDDLHASAEQLLRVPLLMPQPEAPRASLIGLSDDELVDILRGVGTATVLAEQRYGSAAFSAVNRALAADLADAIAERADDILDQLRPAFDAAAAAMRHAVELGLHGRSTDRDVLQADDIAAVRDAWSALPAAARTLEAIAQARIALSVAAGVPPAAERAGIDTIVNVLDAGDLASRMFHDTPRDWHRDGEDGWQRWLRLSEHVTPRLLATEDIA